MKALITGASSGMGRDMARILAKKGYDLILVARRQDRLDDVKKELDVNVECICTDLSIEENCFNLFEKVRDENIDILINNAGFGLFGEFTAIDITREMEMVNTNIKAVHILTKLFLRKFEEKDSGYILNVASAAGFFAGPMLSTYYATKSYVLRLSEAIYEELRRKKSNVKISVLCPGPVGTEFGDVAKVSFGMGGGLESHDVARYAIDKMFRGKLLIVPSLMMKTAVFLRHLISDKLMVRIVYHIQKNKCEH